MQKYSAEQRRAHLEAFGASGLNGKEYCHRENIPATTFYGWIKTEKDRNRKAAQESAKLIRVPSIRSRGAELERITLEAAALRVHLPQSISDDRLGRIIHFLVGSHVH